MSYTWQGLLNQVGEIIDTPGIPIDSIEVDFNHGSSLFGNNQLICKIIQ